MGLTMQTMTLDQIKACKAIVSLYETGSLSGKYDLLVVLEDGAGITFGKNQTTENSGGLFLLLKEYADKKGAFVEALSAYMDLLYDGKDSAKKGMLTEDTAFKDLLVKAAQEDPLMRKAQDHYFHKRFFRPALELAEEYAVTQPLTLCAFYDACIQMGDEGARKLVEKYNQEAGEGEGTEIEKERAWGKGFIQARHTYLTTFTGKSQGHTNAVRKSAYRTTSLLDLAERGAWLLSVPLDVKMNRGTWTLTQEILDQTS